MQMHQRANVAADTRLPATMQKLSRNTRQSFRDMIELALEACLREGLEAVASSSLQVSKSNVSQMSAIK